MEVMWILVPCVQMTGSMAILIGILLAIKSLFSKNETVDKFVRLLSILIIIFVVVRTVIGNPEGWPLIFMIPQFLIALAGLVIYIKITTKKNR